MYNLEKEPEAKTQIFIYSARPSDILWSFMKNVSWFELIFLVHVGMTPSCSGPLFVSGKEEEEKK